MVYYRLRVELPCCCLFSCKQLPSPLTYSQTKYYLVWEYLCFKFQPQCQNILNFSTYTTWGDIVQNMNPGLLMYYIIGLVQPVQPSTLIYFSLLRATLQPKPTQHKRAMASIPILLLQKHSKWSSVTNSFLASLETFNFKIQNIDVFKIFPFY